MNATRDPGHDAAHAAEARRQQALLDAVQGGGLAALAGWPLAAPRAGASRGLEVYRANAGVQAGQVLAAAFPTVAALVGNDAMAGLARAFRRAEPPTDGDLGVWGAALPAFIEADPVLAAEPYLADCARLDWALHLALRAADGPAGCAGLEHLADTDPAALRLRLRAGTALVASRWPVATILDAHARPDGTPGRFDAPRRALAARRGETVLVWRAGWQACHRVLEAPDDVFTAALLDGAPLAPALDAAGTGFDLGRWLAGAVGDGWLQSVEAIDDPLSGDAP